MKTMRINLAVNPGDVSVNRRFAPQFDRGKPTGRIILSSTYRSEVDALAMQVRQACIKQGWKTSKKACHARIFTRWPGPNGDRDACCKAVLDALEKGSAVVNDRQVIPTLDAAWNCKDAGIEVVLEEVSDA